MYEVVNNPLKIISDKCAKGDVGDNILVEQNETSEDAELRRVLVNLLELPPEIEQQGIQALNEVLSYSKSLHLEYLPEFKGVQEKFLKIYKKDKVITSEYCVALKEKRLTRKKKAQTLKRKMKKEIANDSKS
jgi:hypothetical protein